MERTTQIKICGLTRKRDVDQAIQLGANMLGFILTKSPRRLSVIQAQNILNSVPKANWKSIGVFKDNSLDEINSILDQVSFDGIQLHGNESNKFLFDLKKRNQGLFIIKAIGVDKEGNVKCKPDEFDCDTFLVDSNETRNEVQNRTPINCEKILDFSWSKPVFVAGGLTAENVSSFIHRLNPDGVDVSSGIEISPGIKSADKMNAFFHAVSGARV